MPSHLYSFSFAPGHDWSRRFAPQAEIIAYLERIVRELRPGAAPAAGHRGRERALRREQRPLDAARPSDGEEREFDVLVTACGQLTNPAIPRDPGLEDFEGPVFHSAEWDHDHDLSGERVAVIGTGASAIQFVPRIAPRSSS